MIPPIDLLPLPEPRNDEIPLGWFYENVAKPLVKDTVRIMHNGLPIDLNRVYELEQQLDTILEQVQTTINQNTYVKAFLEQKFPLVAAELKAEIESKMRDTAYYLKEFDASNMTHRSFYMLIFMEQHAEDMYDVITPLEEILPGVPKWSVRDVKPFAIEHHEIKRLLNKGIKPTEPTAMLAMQRLAEHKVIIWNKSYHDQVTDISFNNIMKPFNPGSSTQKREFFEYMGIDPIEFSKDTGEASWGREPIEELQRTETDPILLELYQAFIDHSFAAIVRNNFINAFYKYTIDGRLYGQYKLLGAKSGRYTSNSPNMLNAPSTGSIYAKPIKRCFIAPEDYIVYAIDYSALEDRVIASLTKDTNKCNVFLENLDGHCLNAYGYFKDEIAQYMPITGDTTTDVKEFFRLVEEGHKELKAIRQKGKPATFGLSYGAYPPKVAKSLKISLGEATTIFENYHYMLYPGITHYRENYVLTTAEQNRRIHLGMGFYISTDNPDKDIRTLNNATCQFWSILTALAINKIHTLIDEKGWSDKIQVTSTIYDSIYFIVKRDSEVIKWLNDNITSIMATDFIDNQIVKNEATGEIGMDWSSLQQLSQKATIEEIKEMLKGIA